MSNGRYHTVELLSQKKNFTLRVDQGKARSMINEGEHEYLRLNTPLFIGGLPSDSAERAARQWQLRNTTSFRGCIKGHPFDFNRQLLLDNSGARLLEVDS